VELNVGYEVAALLFFQTRCRIVEGKLRLSISDIISAFTSDGPARKRLHGEVRKLPQALDAFKDFCTRHNVKRVASLNKGEAIAISFLQSSKRLLWQGHNGCHAPPCYLGEPLVRVAETAEAFVGIVFSRQGAGLHCNVSIPISGHILSAARLELPEESCKVLGDSTFQAFREKCCEMARSSKVDVKYWYAKPGMWESDCPEIVRSARVTDISVVVPNGVRHSLQEHGGPKKWVDRCCAELASALQLSCKKAICFVGSGTLCPGVPYPNEYCCLIRSFIRNLRKCGIPVISDAPQMQLTPEQIHWCPSSSDAVSQLFRELLQNAQSTTTFNVHELFSDDFMDTLSPSASSSSSHADTTLERRDECIVPERKKLRSLEHEAQKTLTSTIA
jgi:hypothetical protein